eukprot:COSAG06_NODE_2116_length_7557_cov_122.672298_6_plen_146_part_00
MLRSRKKLWLPSSSKQTMSRRPQPMKESPSSVKLCMVASATTRDHIWSRCSFGRLAIQYIQCTFFAKLVRRLQHSGHSGRRRNLSVRYPHSRTEAAGPAAAAVAAAALPAAALVGASPCTQVSGYSLLLLKRQDQDNRVLRIVEN